MTIERIIGENGGFDILRARSKEEEDKLWDVRRAISPSLMKYGTLKINEDVVVPRSKVPELVARIEEIGKRHDTFVANFGHAGDGNIHVNFVVDRDDPDADRPSPRMRLRDLCPLSRTRRNDLRRTWDRLREGPIYGLRHRQTDARGHERHQKSF